MSSSLFDTVRQIVREELKQQRSSELGVVQEVHPHTSADDKDNYACTVVMRDSGLVLKKVPVATQNIGHANIPNVDDLVLLQFIGGDINAPVVTGRLYNDQDRPPENDINQSIIHLPLGAEEAEAVHIELHHGDNKKCVFQFGTGLLLTFQDDDPAVEINVDNEKAKITITKDGAIIISGQGDVIIEGNNIDITAQGELNLTGTTINLN